MKERDHYKTAQQLSDKIYEIIAEFSEEGDLKCDDHEKRILNRRYSDLVEKYNSIALHQFPLKIEENFSLIS